MPPEAPEASRSAPPARAMSRPVTMMVPPFAQAPAALAVPEASSLPETFTLPADTRISPPAALPPLSAPRATTFWETVTVPPSPAVRNTRPLLVATPVALVRLSVLPASA